MKDLIGIAFAGSLIIYALAAALTFTQAQQAHEIRLIGECDGKFYGAMEEDQFPTGCAWIEPIRFDTE